jgi:hypothetical protein
MTSKIKTSLLGAAAWLALATGAQAAAPANNCDRACLEEFVDTYLDAVIDDAPQEAPLDMNVIFTENGQRLPLGEGLWKSMKAKGDYRLFVTDVPAQVVTVFTTVKEDDRDPKAEGIPAFMFLRLRIHDGKITEIEQILERNPDTARRVEALGEPREAFLTEVPEGDRMSRHAMIVTANKYFTGMASNDGKGDYPFADDCDRIENGGHSTNTPLKEGETMPDPATSTNYSAHWTCMQQFKSGLLHFVTRIRDRRWVALDEERGLAVAVAFFDHMAGSTRTFETPAGKTVTAGPTQPWTWYIAEVFKVSDDKIHEIEAFLTRPPYGMNSGWSSYADGMSSAARDVTGVEEE